MTRLAVAAPVAALLLLLSGCTAATAAGDSTETYVPGPQVSLPAGSPTEAPIEADATLVIEATATSASGASLALRMVVHGSTTFDDIATQTLPQALTEQCAAAFPAERFTSETWSFTRVNLSAVPGAGAWPADSFVGLLPSGSTTALAGRGFVLDDPASTSAVPCERAKRFTGSGTGAMSVGISHDATALTGWAAHRWGFIAPSGVTLSGCSIQLTALGTQAGGGTDWTPSSTSTACSTGPATESPAY